MLLNTTPPQKRVTTPLPAPDHPFSQPKSWEGIPRFHPASPLDVPNVWHKQIQLVYFAGVGRCVGGKRLWMLMGGWWMMEHESPFEAPKIRVQKASGTM